MTDADVFQVCASRVRADSCAGKLHERGQQDARTGRWLRSGHYRQAQRRQKQRQFGDTVALHRQEVHSGMLYVGTIYSVLEVTAVDIFPVSIFFPSPAYYDYDYDCYIFLRSNPLIR